MSGYTTGGPLSSALLYRIILLSYLAHHKLHIGIIHP
jgi:hypothetical protein